MFFSYKFREIYGNRSYILEDEGVFCAWQNSYNEKSGLCRFDVSLFEEQEDGSYLRDDETIKERCYSELVLRKMLAEAGFSVLETFDGYSSVKPNDVTERMVFVTRVNK